MHTSVMLSKALDVPLNLIMGEQMYNNWRRRMARLDRADITATPARRRALRLARQRLGGTP